MSKAKELAIETYESKYELIYEDNFFQILNALVKINNPNDNRLQELLEYRKKLISIIEDDGRWEYQHNRFVNRSNFKYNPIDREITFRTNVIYKGSNNAFCLRENSSPKAKEHFAKYKEYFAGLNKIEKAINTIYKQYQSRVDFALLLTSDRRTIKDIDPSIRARCTLKQSTPVHKTRRDATLKSETRSTRDFIHTYQKDGLKRVIRWLNTLNGPEDIDTLYTDFIEEYAPFTFIPEKDDFKDPVKMSIANYMVRTLKVLRTYSPRGRFLTDKKNLEDNKKETLNV